MKTRVLGIGLLVAVAMSAAHATPITNTVTVGDKEWAQVNLFTPLSWNTVDEVCPDLADGVCNEGETLNGWTMTGWTWASIFDVGELFSALTPHPGAVITAVRELDSEWAPAFFAESGFEPTQTLSASELIRGVTRTTNPFATFQSYLGIVVNQQNTDPRFRDLVDTSVSRNKNFGSANTGVWFYRPATVQVPAPATLPLLGLALGLLAALRRIGRRTR
jgi:hypothetical protein